MTKFVTYAAVVIALSASVTLAISPLAVKPGTAAEALFAADGAFRDGLYLGQLAAEHGRSVRPAIGRWSSQQDRAMFAAGYQRGYNEFLASALGGH